MAKRTRTERTDELALQAWRLAQQGSSRAEVANLMGIGLSTAHRWIAYVRDTPSLQAQAELTPDNGVKPEKKTRQPAKIKQKRNTTLQEENNYLRWCLEGERKGYVDRLLEELDK